MIVGLIIVIVILLLSPSSSSKSARGLGIFKRQSMWKNPSGFGASTLVTEDNFISILDTLRLKYYKDFKIAVSGNKFGSTDYNRQKILILTQCRAEMNNICGHVSFPQYSMEDTLLDLERDMDGYVDSVLLMSPDLEAIPPTNNYSARVKEFFATKRGKQVRWIIAQSILLLLNFAQNEWAQKVARRAVDRRLAEIPEFPLL